MLDASNPAIEERGAIRAQAAPKPRPSPPRRPAAETSKESFLDHYFKRLNPEVAATFTEEQRDAIAVMFGAREIANHSIEIRRSIPFGRRRFYLVLLMGPERRNFIRLHGQVPVARPFNLLFYLGAAALLLLPVLALLYGTGL
ncbi:MAG TPA: hypothetical protein VIK47_00940 [Kiloniellales bacterium]